jgi:hypothetical protein
VSRPLLLTEKERTRASMANMFERAQQDEFAY